MKPPDATQVSDASEQVQQQTAADLAVIFLILQSSILDGVRQQPHGDDLLSGYKAWILAAVSRWPADYRGRDQARIKMLMRERAEGLFREMELALAMGVGTAASGRPN